MKIPDRSHIGQLIFTSVVGEKVCDLAKCNGNECGSADELLSSPWRANFDRAVL